MKTVKTILAVVVATIAFNATAAIDVSATNEAIAHGSRYASSNGARLGQQSIQSQRAATNVTNSMNAFNSAPAATRSAAAQAVADAQNAQAGVNAAASNSAHQVAVNSASVAAASASITANTATVNPMAGKQVSGYAPQPGAYSVATPSPKAPTQTKAPTMPSPTTITNTTSAAAAQAALTAGKMASSVAPVGTAPNTMMPGKKTNPVGNPVAITNKPANSAINVAASSLKPSTPVKVGNIVTTAGAIAKTNPTAQISVPTESVFGAPSRANHSDRSNGSRSEGHQGRGAENAHSHAFGGHGYGHDNSRSEGFGGHSHFH